MGGPLAWLRSLLSGVLPSGPTTRPPGARGEWQSLPPIQRAAGALEPTADSLAFARGLPGARGPRPALEPLGHQRMALAPAGLVALAPRPAPRASQAPALPFWLRRAAQRRLEAAEVAPELADVSPEPADVSRERFQPTLHPVPAKPPSSLPLTSATAGESEAVGMVRVPEMEPAVGFPGAGEAAGKEAPEGSPALPQDLPEAESAAGVRLNLGQSRRLGLGLTAHFTLQRRHAPGVDGPPDLPGGTSGGGAGSGGATPPPGPRGADARATAAKAELQAGQDAAWGGAAASAAGDSRRPPLPPGPRAEPLFRVQRRGAPTAISPPQEALEPAAPKPRLEPPPEVGSLRHGRIPPTVPPAAPTEPTEPTPIPGRSLLTQRLAPASSSPAPAQPVQGTPLPVAARLQGPSVVGRPAEARGAGQGPELPLAPSSATRTPTVQRSSGAPGVTSVAPAWGPPVQVGAVPLPSPEPWGPRAAPAMVQRIEPPQGAQEVAAEAPAGLGPSLGAAAVGQGGKELDEFTHQLYERFRSLLRAELLVDRERAGRITDLR